MLFYELLQVAIGNRTALTHTPSEEEWREVFALAQKQAMMGVAFRGVERLGADQRPPKSLLMPWYVTTERIKAMNADLDAKALRVANRFRKDGFRSVVLKGQGIARLYVVKDGAGATTSLKDYRMPGDIDIWLEGKRGRILDYVRQHDAGCKPVYHHVDFPEIGGTEIEVHFTPSWMNDYFVNRRLQRFFRKEGVTPFASQEVRGDYDEIPTPSLAFNRVYILVHIYRHLFGEGIGLRQLLDYYFVLAQGCSAEEREETMRVLRELRMQRFAAAVMWVLQEVFAMDEGLLLTRPDEREGRFLLNEIMLAGNFGKYDERIRREASRGE